MNRRRRAVMLIGLALIVGALAAADVASRERALTRQLAPLVDVVVATKDLGKGAEIGSSDLAVKKIPERYAPTGVARVRNELVGARLAIGITRGSFIAPDSLVREQEGREKNLPRRGERAVEVIALGSHKLIRAG